MKIMAGIANMARCFASPSYAPKTDATFKSRCCLGGLLFSERLEGNVQHTICIIPRVPSLTKNPDDSYYIIDIP